MGIGKVYTILGQRRSSEGLCLFLNGGNDYEKTFDWYYALGGYGQGKLLDVAGIYERTGGGGSVTVMLPLVDEEASLEQLADLCDGFLFAGGHRRFSRRLR